MLVFIPFHTSGTFSKKEADFCNSLNTKNDFRCLMPSCENANSAIFVDASNGQQINLTIGKYCCEGFKLRIEKYIPLGLQ
jgi:hypothetical protein